MEAGVPLHWAQSKFFFIDYKYKFGIIKLLILILLFIIETLVSVVALFGRHPATEGVEFWITYLRQAFLSIFNRLQVIQNKRPWCWVAAYVTAGFDYVKEIIWKLVEFLCIQ